MVAGGKSHRASSSGPARSLKSNSLLITVPNTSTSLHLPNTIMPILSFDFDSISVREAGQGLLCSDYIDKGTEDPRSIQGHRSSRSRANSSLQMLVLFSFQNMLLSKFQVNNFCYCYRYYIHYLIKLA